MTKKTIILSLFCCIFLSLLPFKLIAQDTGQVIIDASYKIERLVDKHIEINKLHPEIDGYRVQVYFDSGRNSKSKAFDVYKEFVAKYPGVEAYVTFQEPNYKVRVGDFRTRLEAQGFMQEILEAYPSAFVIKDKIQFPPLNEPGQTDNAQ